MFQSARRTGTDLKLNNDKIPIAVPRCNVDAPAWDFPLSPIIYRDKARLYLIELSAQQAVQFLFISQQARANRNAFPDWLFKHDITEISLKCRIQPNEFRDGKQRWFRAFNH